MVTRRQDTSDSTLRRLVQGVGTHLVEQLEDKLKEPETLQLLVHAYTQLCSTELKAERLKLDRARQERDTGRCYLKFYHQQEARSIAEADFDNSEKINQLGQLIFADLWDGIEDAPVSAKPRATPNSK